MPALDNARHELFAQEIAKGSPARDAYLTAGFATKSDGATDANASRLLSTDKVQSRVTELKERAATGAVTTIESLLEAGWAIMKEAREAKDFSAASSTLERAAKIAGLWTDKAQTTHSGDLRAWLLQQPPE